MSGPARNNPFTNPLSRLSLAGQPPLIVTLGVSILSGVTSGVVLLGLAWGGVLHPGSWFTVLLAWIAGIALTATLSYTIGGSIWGPYSWLLRAIDMLSVGDFDFPAEPTALEVQHLRRGLRQIADELLRYRELQIDDLILEKSELQSILDSMTEGLVVYDLNLKPALMNPAFRRMAQAEGVHAMVRPFGSRWIHPEQLSQLEEAMRQAPDRPRVDILELDAPKQFLKRFTSPLYNGDGIQVGHLALYHDITPEIEADHLKSEFISNASHELRTPVTSLKVLVESLMDGAQEDPELRRSFINDIYTELERMHVLVNDLLDLAALEAKRGLNRQELDVRGLLDEAVATVQPQAAKRDISLTLSAADLSVSADRTRLRQILVNLLANAVKFTPNGGTVSLSAQSVEQGARFVVSDTGIGIPAKDLPHIFDRFFRVTRGRSRLQGGSGLGLTIVKQAVEAHQGEIAVESTEGKGTTITFTIPASDF